MVSFKVKLSGSEATYDVDDVDEVLSVGEVKATVEVLVGVPKESQKWIYKGRILTDQMIIGEVKIDEGNTIIVMKTAVAAISTKGQAQAAATQPTPVVRSSAPIVSVFDRAMFQLLENQDESAIFNAVGLLIKIISNILSNPNEEKYRKISRINAAFIKRLGALTGGPSCMEALGFELQGDDWILFPSGEAWENMVACKKKLEKFSDKLALSLASKPAQARPSVPPPLPAPVQPQIPVAPPLDAATMLLMQQLIQGLASASIQSSAATTGSASTGTENESGAAAEGSTETAVAEETLNPSEEAGNDTEDAQDA